jgi:hypothetical protein
MAGSARSEVDERPSTVVQWDIGAMLSADGAADESVSPQSGASAATQPRSGHRDLGIDLGEPRVSLDVLALADDTVTKADAVGTTLQLAMVTKPKLLGPIAK